jgi:hypothetical protein
MYSGDKIKLQNPDLNQFRYKEYIKTKPVTAFEINGIVRYNAFSFEFNSSVVARKKLKKNALKFDTGDVNEKRKIDCTPCNTIMQMCLDSSVPSKKLEKEIHRCSKTELNRCHSNGLTALFFTVLRKDVVKCKLLLQGKAQVDLQDDVGFTALHYAVGEYYNLEITKLLLQHNANVNIRSKRGFTPLFAACKLENVDAIKLLLERGADPFVQNDLDDKNIYDSIMGKEEIERLFKNAGHENNNSTFKFGIGLWIVPSFMNHSDNPSTRREFAGKMMFVYASRGMKKDSEVTTSYGLSQEKLKYYGIA